MKKNIHIAIIQEGPVYLDLKKSLKKMMALIKAAAKNGAELINMDYYKESLRLHKR